MNTDFIKWMCERADGFEIDTDGEKEWLWLPDGECLDLHNDYSILGNMVLLQRAIEGVNITTDFYIRQEFDIITVSSMVVGSQTYVFDFSHGIDTAKQSALEYIYEQEQQ